MKGSLPWFGCDYISEMKENKGISINSDQVLHISCTDPVFFTFLAQIELNRTELNGY